VRTGGRWNWSGLCLLVGFDISVVEHSGFATKVLVFN
jgi:hypothetical protein